MPESRPAGIQVRDLSKRYATFEAVRGVSFEAAPGEILGLLGRNGAGKTTTLECILGLRTPDAGRISVCGIDVRTRPAEARAVVGALLQGATLQEKITPREAVRLFSAFYRTAAEPESLLGRFGLTAKADASFASLSGGLRQRLFLGLAFAHQPRVVVLDEPTAGLDPQARHELQQAIANARRDGVAILLSTHDLEEAQQVCDRIGIIDRGALLAVGTVPELLGRTGARPKLRVTTERPVSLDSLANLPGVASVTGEECSTEVVCAELNRAIVSVVGAVSSAGNSLMDLQIQRPSLKDVFLELTGGEWKEDAT